jgi:hypothetical protein
MKNRFDDHPITILLFLLVMIFMCFIGTAFGVTLIRINPYLMVIAVPLVIFSWYLYVCMCYRLFSGEWPDHWESCKYQMLNWRNKWKRKL